MATIGKKKSNARGFLLCLLLILLPLLLFSQEIRLKVTAEQANIRAKPDIGSAILLQVPQGTVITSGGKEDEWYVVRVEPEEGSAITGYVHESLVTLIEPPQKRPPKKEAEKPKPPPPPPETPREIKPEKPATPPAKPPPSPKPESPPKPALPSVSPAGTGFSFTLGGGGHRASVGDLNEGAQGLSDLTADSLAVKGKGEVAPLHQTYLFGAELIIPISSRASFGIGGDVLLGRKTSTVLFEKGLSKTTLTTRPEVRAIPISFTLTYHILPFLYTKAGAEYYLAECRYFYRLEKDKTWEEWEGKASGQGLGVLGGLGIEVPFRQNLALVLEATGRYARVGGFTGKNVYADSFRFESEEEGKLYFYQGKIYGEKSYPLLFIREKKPTEAGVSDVREAELDFSGIKLKAALKFSF